MADALPQINATEVAIKYAVDVYNGSIVAGNLVKLAAKRFLRDMKYGHERGLYYSPEKAQHVVTFFGYLRHSKGEWGPRQGRKGEVFVLQPWQVFILVNLFGWYKADGTRRFREAYIEVARKNGKSTFMSGIGLYMLVADDEPGAEVYTAATKKEQAKIIFNESVKMRDASEYLAARIDKAGGKHCNNMFVLSTGSKFEPQASEDQTLDGLNSHCILIDELHVHPTRALYDVLHESTASRRNPLTIAITTAGFDKLGICFKQRTIGEQILIGAVEACKTDDFFAFIACMDEGDDWKDEKNWPKANPNLGVSAKLDKLRAAAEKAKMDPTALNSFLRKHLNVWTSQDVAWMPMTKWALCNVAGPLVPVRKLREQALEFLKGRECYGGMDLSSKIDLAAFALVFPPVKERKEKRPKGGKFLPNPHPGYPGPVQQWEDVVVVKADPNWYVLVWHFMPKDNIEGRVKNDRVPYNVWLDEGFIFGTDGTSIDYAFIRDTIKSLAKRFHILECGFDDWNAQQLATELEQDGMKMVAVGQGFKSMSDPMKRLLGLVLGKQVEHFGDPVLTWEAGNVQAVSDPADNIKPDKKRSREKIDGVVAVITAMNRTGGASVNLANEVYSKRGIVFL